MPQAKPPTRELVALFKGDRDSYGYYHPMLVREICRRLTPPDFEAIRVTVYGGAAVEDIDPLGYEALQRGFEIWNDELRLRKAVTSGGSRSLP